MSLSRLFIFVFGFSIGILFWIAETEPVFMYASILLLAFVGISLSFKKEKRLSVLIVGVIFAFSALAGYFYTALREQQPSPTVQARVGGAMVIEGVVASNPIQDNAKTSFVFKTKEGKFRAVIYSQDIISFGDKLLINGTISLPENFETETGKLFDYKNYLGKDGIFFILTVRSFKVIETKDFSITKTLFTIFNKANNMLYSYIRFPESALARGVLLGDDSALPEKVKDAYIQTGTIHIVALSGYNISILLTWILFITRRFLKYKWGTLIALLGVAGFVLGTGGSQTAIRAGIMGSLALVANYYGRPQLAQRLLLLTYIIMIFINPFVLPYDVSFHLSFLATFGIIGFQKKFEVFLSFFPKLIRELTATTFSAQLLVVPYLAFVFGQLSIISLVTNIIIGPLVPLLMIGSAGVIVFGIIFIPFGIFVGFLTTGVSWILTQIVIFFSNIPFASISVPEISSWILIGYYFIVFLWYLRLSPDQYN